ncbi:hypothetical protein TURU_152341 [Turdus rufiventris]|nr:hypothetical protein TURU_152341 [Turdus rufiventris]
MDAHVPKSQSNEECHNNKQVDQGAKVKVSQVDLTMDNISQVIHNWETCAAIKQAEWVKPQQYGGQWLKYRYGEAWQTDYTTLPQTWQGKHYMLTMVEATTGWLETYLVPHATAWNTILGLEKQDKHPQLLTGLVFKNPHQPCCPSLDTLQALHVLETQNWTQHSRREEEDGSLEGTPPKTPSSPISSRTRKQTVQAPLQQAVGPEGERMLVKVPFSTISLKAWKKVAKNYHSDPINTAKRLQYMIKQHNPDWSDMQLLLDALIETEKQLVLKKAGDLAEEFYRAQQEDVKEYSPLQDPKWNPDRTAEMKKLESYQE